MTTVSTFSRGALSDPRPIATQVVRQRPIRSGTSDGMSVGAPHGSSTRRHRLDTTCRPDAVREVSP